MKEKNVIIEDINISYKENIINEEKDILFFLHGWGSNSDAFLKIYPKNKNWIALDFPNFGKSSKSKKALNMEDYARITKKFIDKKIKDKKTTFICHSFGGRVLLKMTSIYNDINIKKIIFSGVPFYRQKTKKINKSVLIIKYFHKIFDLPILKLIKKPIQKILYKIIYSKDYLALQNDEIMKTTFKNVVSDDISKYLNSIKNYEKILIWGENDQTVPIEIPKKFIKENPNTKLLIIKNSQHFPFVENTEEFLKYFNQEIN